MAGWWNESLLGDKEEKSDVRTSENEARKTQEEKRDPEGISGGWWVSGVT